MHWPALHKDDQAKGTAADDRGHSDDPDDPDMGAFRGDAEKEQANGYLEEDRRDGIPDLAEEPESKSGLGGGGLDLTEMSPGAVRHASQLANEVESEGHLGCKHSPVIPAEAA